MTPVRIPLLQLLHAAECRDCTSSWAVDNGPLLSPSIYIGESPTIRPGRAQMNKSWCCCCFCSYANQGDRSWWPFVSLWLNILFQSRSLSLFQFGRLIFAELLEQQIPELNHMAVMHFGQISGGGGDAELETCLFRTFEDYCWAVIFIPEMGPPTQLDCFLRSQMPHTWLYKMESDTRLLFSSLGTSFSRKSFKILSFRSSRYPHVAGTLTNCLLNSFNYKAKGWSCHSSIDSWADRIEGGFVTVSLEGDGDLCKMMRLWSWN